MCDSSLAIGGGQPVRIRPFAPWPYFAQDEIEAAASPLKTGNVNYWTGNEGREFEREFAAFAGSDYAVALANGTVALELALATLGIGSGDEVIVTSRTFIASASAVVMRGAVPVFADVDPVTQNITADTIQDVLSIKTKAIITVHLAGWPCEMGPIMELAMEYGLKVIEDCAQAHGARYEGKPVGSIGDIAAFSFCQDKILTTGGEGGMLVTSDEQLWKKAWAFKDHGKEYDTVYTCEHPPGFRWLHESFGTNWRLTEMQSAIGRIQLRRLPEWVETRRCHAAMLTAAFKTLPALRVTEPAADIYHAYYKYYVFLRSEVLLKGWDKERIMAAVNAEGIPCFSGSCSEIYLEKAFQKNGIAPKQRLPTAKKLGESSLMFQVHPTLARKDIEDTIVAVEKVLKVATK